MSAFSFVRTLRFRVALSATLAVFAVLCAASAWVVANHARVLRENLDESLQQGAASIEAAVAAGQIPKVLGGFGDDDAVGHVIDAHGVVLAATANVTGREAVLQAVAPVPDRRPRTFRDLPRTDGPFRVIAYRVDSPNGPAVVRVGAPLDDIDDSTEALVDTLTFSVPGVVALLAAGLWLFVGRTLRPVEAMRAEVADISGSDLHRRIQPPGSGDEIARLADTMNGMLDRLEAAVRAQRQFVADASHELRSPLTRIRSELEVDLADPDHADLVSTHRSVLEEAAALQRLVEDLLHLARSDAAAAEPHRQPVDLDDIVLKVAAGVRAEERVVVVTAAVTAVQVLADGPQLTRALTNLAENAARHAASRVEFSAALEAGWAVVTVADDGPGIPAAERERIFDRFARLDDARQRDRGGSGLGLAIARDIAERHGGTLILDATTSAGARFVLTLPDSSG